MFNSKQLKQWDNAYFVDSLIGDEDPPIDLKDYVAEQHAADQRNDYGLIDSMISATTLSFNDDLLGDEDPPIMDDISPAELLHPDFKRKIWDSLAVLPDPEKTFDGDKEALDDYKYFEIWKDAHDTINLLAAEHPSVDSTEIRDKMWNKIADNNMLFNAALRHYDRIQDMPMSKVYGSVFGEDFNKVARGVANKKERAKPENWERVYH